ncbi:MAG: hypothetical protein PHE96_11585 [Methylococcales bacterium]|nr:hypothetical protein [Methylococcales bacterium]
MALVLTILPFIAYSLFVLFSAKSHSIQLTLHNPFCIQVPARTGYKEIGSVFDLAGLRMFSAGVKNHAVLVVGDVSDPHLYHWSYWNNRFVEGAYGPPPIYCKPRVSFFENLESSFWGSKNEISFAFHGYRFSIPKSYDPRPEWPSPDSLTLTARAPEFIPTNGVLCDEHLCNMIDIRFEISSRLEAWRSVPDDGHRVENLGETNGLTKQRVWVTGISSPGIQYFSLDNRGNVKTIILCFEETKLQCLHTFEADGITYSTSFHKNIYKIIRNVMILFLVTR